MSASQPVLVLDAGNTSTQLNSAAQAFQNLDVYSTAMLAVQPEYYDPTTGIKVQLSDVDADFAQQFYAAQANALIWRDAYRTAMIQAVYGSIETAGRQYAVLAGQLLKLLNAIPANTQPTPEQSQAIMSQAQAIAQLFQKIEADVKEAQATMTDFSEKLTADDNHLAEGEDGVAAAKQKVLDTYEPLIMQGGPLTGFYNKVLGDWGTTLSAIENALPQLTAGNADATAAISGMLTGWSGLSDDADGAVEFIQLGLEQTDFGTEDTFLTTALAGWETLVDEAKALQPGPPPPYPFPPS